MFMVMGEFGYYLLFLFAWVFFQSLWLSRLAKQVAVLHQELDSLKKAHKR